MKIREFYHADTSTLSYAVYDEASSDAVVIDPVLDYDPVSSKISGESVGKLTAFLNEEQLKPRLILETHAHADHISGARRFRESFPEARLGIGKYITKVQETFRAVFNLTALKADGSQFDLLMDEGKDVAAGMLTVKTLFTPGHTPGCCAYLIGDAVFTGDALFTPDSGTGRCDFPGGSAEDLYRSITEKLYTLPAATKVFVGHDYQPGGRELRFKSTIVEEKSGNIHLDGSTPKEKFVEFRAARDKTLEAPRLLLPSIQVNIAGGELPAPEANGKRYLKIPIRG